MTFYFIIQLFIALRSQMADSYVLNNGQYQPINVIASGGVKCVICSKMFPSTDISDHLSQHIQPQYLVPNTSTNSLKRLNIPDHLLHETDTDNSDLGIISMNPQQFPNTQGFRRVNLPPRIQSEMNPSNLKNQLNSKGKIDVIDLTSYIGRGLQNEEIQFLDVETPIKMSADKVQVHKKGVSIYQNGNKHHESYDETQNLKRQRPVEIKQNQENLYKIIQKPLLDTDYSDHSSNIDKPITLTRRTNFVLAPKTIIRIDTKNRQQSQYSQEPLTPTKKRVRNFNDSTGHSKYSDRSELTPPKHEPCNCKCTFCGGFYCNVCKSDVPPQFRPVPDPNKSKQQRQMEDSKVTQYWNERNRNKDNQHCQNCHPSSN